MLGLEPQLAGDRSRIHGWVPDAQRQLERTGTLAQQI
jgi:hypothetical protein